MNRDDLTEGSHRARSRAEKGRSPEAFEDCAKAIFALQRRQEGPVSTTSLAERLGITPGGVSTTLKRMAIAGLVDHQPYRGVTLTAAGRRLALEVLRHHRLLETYLSQALGMPWDRVHDEAEVLEHHISEELEELLASALGEPRFDPHGDPIPNQALEEIDPDDATVSLLELKAGDRGRLARVSDSDPEILRFLDQRGIGIGSEIELTERQEFQGPLFLEVDNAEHVLGVEVARRMRIAEIDSA